MNDISKILVEEKFRNSIFNLKTPAYIYHLDILEFILKYIKNNTENMENLKLYYALKANSNIEILNYLHKYVDGVDVASIYEYRKVESIFKNKDISITGPSFTKNHIKEFYRNGEKFDYNSYSQLENCIDIASKGPVGIRVNIPYNFKNAELESRFGISLTDRRFYKILKEFDIQLERLHFHNGEKNQSFFDILRNQLNILKEEGILKNIKEVNMGGGLQEILVKGKMPWFINEIKKIEREFFNNQNVIFIIEPGGGILHLCGILVTKVISADFFEEVNNIVVDSSAYNLNHWFKPKLLSHTSMSKAEVKTNIYGTTCYEGDFFNEGKYMKRLNINDKLLFFPVGAYSKSNHTTLHNFSFPQEYYFSKDVIL